MSDKPISDLRRRMIADITIRTFSDKTRHDYIPHVEAFARFLRMRVHSSASARTGGLRPTLHSDWNVIAIGPLRIVENAVTRTMHHGAFEHFQEKWIPVSVRKCDRVRETEQLLFP
jgi:predicted amidohydrolase YtcJ